jgi:hypothetical protein
MRSTCTTQMDSTSRASAYIFSKLLYGLRQSPKLWHQIFKAINFDPDSQPEVRCDNTQTLRLLQSQVPILNTRLKHVDIAHHWASSRGPNRPFNGFVDSDLRTSGKRSYKDTRRGIHQTTWSGTSTERIHSRIRFNSLGGVSTYRLCQLWSRCMIERGCILRN